MTASATLTPALDAAITDQTIEDLASIAWYGGINYWAEPYEGNVSDDVVIGVIDSEGDERAIWLTRADLVKAYAQLLDLNQAHVNRRIHGYFLDSWRDRNEEGIDMTHIDADAGDVWVQVAAFGEVVYG